MPPKKKAAPKKKAVRRKKATPKKKKFQLEQWHKTCIIILATAAVFGLGGRVINGVVTACTNIDNRWTHTKTFVEKTFELEEDIELVSKRLDQKILQDQIDWRWKQMQELMSKFGSFEKMPQWARDKYLGLQKEIDDIKAGKKMAF